jgi:LPS sulfotransferase NodH
VTSDLEPTFLIIGAPKSGTTSLFSYLGTHPQVFSSPVKEPRFFAFGESSPVPAQLRGAQRPPITEWARYLALFHDARADQARGEASVSYLYTRGTIERIRQCLPEVRLVVILRSPAEAVWSGYQAFRRANEVREPIERLLEREPLDPPTDLEPAGGATQLLRIRFYDRHLARWFSAFEEEQLLVCLYDDLVADPAALFPRIFRHIGVDPDMPIDTSRRENRGADPRSRMLDRWLHRPGRGLLAAKRVLAPLPGVRSARRSVDRWNAAPPPGLPADIRARLVEIYKEDTLALEARLGRDLSAWRASQEMDHGAEHVPNEHPHASLDP